MGEVVECLSEATNSSGMNLDAGGARRVSDREVANQFSATPSNKINFWEEGNIGCLFVWFVYFGHAK
jgi:hypothetical protein